MKRIANIVQWETSSGQPVVRGDLKVTPQWRTLLIRLPFAWYGVQRPVAVLVERRGETKRIRIVDATRLVEASLGMMAFAGRLVLQMAGTRRTGDEGNVRQHDSSEQERRNT